MERRNFIAAATTLTLGLTYSSFNSFAERKKTSNIRGVFSLDNNKISIYTNSAITPTRVFHITDTHLSVDDERGVPFQKYSERMAGAYKINNHFQTGEEVTTK